MFERVIIASGTSNRQTKALAASVRDSVKSRGMQVLSTEGEDNGEWIIVDCGAAVAHIMQPAIREYYHLEEIWGGKNVRIKIGEVSTKLVKASEPEPVAKPAAKQAAAKKFSAPRPPSKRTPSRAEVAQTAARKSDNRTAAFKRVAAKGPARSGAKTAAGKTTASKAAPSKSAASKTAARKAPARKATRG